jgi:hypothetical protein
MKILTTFITALLLLPLCVPAFGQLTPIEVSGKDWQLYGHVKYVGPAKASLEYMVDGSDTTFLLLMYDMRPELRKYFSITFSSRDNTLGRLYEELMLAFDKEKNENQYGIRMFVLGNEKVSIYRSATLGTKAIILTTDKGKIELSKAEIKRLFKK